MSRITKQLLQSKTSECLSSTEYIDLSNHNIVAIEKLTICPNLKTLILRGNLIDSVQNLENCTEIWKLDLSYNNVRSLDGLCRFVALGSLTLAYNNLSWRELIKIRHLHIVNLSLHNNPLLDRDPHYRIHVIDCLPNVWMLDGKLITSAERLQVSRFFQESALKPHPVRHKVIREPFKATQFKTNIIYGSKAVDMSSRFPARNLHNVDSDRRHLKFIAFDFQNELNLKLSYMKWQRLIRYKVNLVENLIEYHSEQKESCNMLLLLLVVSLEFTIPLQLMRETLQISQLHNICDINTMDLFNLNRQDRCHIATLLLGAAKIDRESGKEGGLYDKLYLCLYYTVTELYKVSNSDNVSKDIQTHKFSKMYHQYRCVLAAEVCELLCAVPMFFEYISADQGIISLVNLATGSTQLCPRINKFLARLKTREVSDWNESLEGIAEMIVSAIKKHIAKVFADDVMEWNLASSHILFRMKYLPMKRPQSSPVYFNDYLVTGRATPETGLRPRTAGTRFRSQGANIHTPALGDVVILGPQNTATIIAIPQDGIAMVYVGEVTADNGGVIIPNSRGVIDHDQYIYIDMNQLDWDQSHCQWRPVGSSGDRITIQLIHNPDELLLPNTDTNNIPQSAEGVKNSQTPVVGMSSVLREKLNLNLDTTTRHTTTGAERSDSLIPLPMVEHKLWTLSKSLVDDTLHDISEDDICIEPDQPPPTPVQDFDDDIVIHEVSTANDNTSEDTERVGEGGSVYVHEHTTHTPSLTTLVLELDVQSDSCLPSVPTPTPTTPTTTTPTTTTTVPNCEDAKTKTTSDSYKSSSDLLGQNNSITVKELKMEILNYPTRMESERNLSDLRSFYQRQREEVWRKTSHIIHGPPLTSERSMSPLLQPPCTPTVPFGHPLGYPSNRTQSAKSFRHVDKSTSSPRKGKMANNWLAGGKDLHRDKLQLQRPKSADLHLPGWIDGLDDKSKSLTIAKMLRRTQIQLSSTTSHWAVDYDKVSSRVSSATVTLRPFGSNTPRDQLKCHDCWTQDSQCQSGRHMKAATRKHRPASSITYQWT